MSWHPVGACWMPNGSRVHAVTPVLGSESTREKELIMGAFDNAKDAAEATGKKIGE